MARHNLLVLRDAAVEHIKSAFTEKGFFVAAHPGPFNETDIRQAAQKTPAILTSMLRIRESDDTLDFASFVLYRATSTDKLYDGAIAVTSKLIAVLKDLEHELCLDVPSEVSAECLFSGQLDSMNITLWAVRWSWQLQPYVVSGDFTLPDTLEIFAGYDAEHNIGDALVPDTVTVNEILGG